MCTKNEDLHRSCPGPIASYALFIHKYVSGQVNGLLQCPLHAGDTCRSVSRISIPYISDDVMIRCNDGVLGEVFMPACLGVAVWNARIVVEDGIPPLVSIRHTPSLRTEHNV